MAQAKRDQNRVPTLIAVSDADSSTPIVIEGDATTAGLNVNIVSNDVGETQYSTDSFQAVKTSADAQAATEIKAATTGERIYITDIIISTDTALNLQIQDDTGTPVVLIEDLFLPANSVFAKSFKIPPRTTAGQALDVIASASGNVSVTVTGYVK